MDNSTHTWEIDKRFRHMILTQKVLRVFYDFKRYIVEKTDIADSLKTKFCDPDSNKLEACADCNIFLSDEQELGFYIDINYLFGFDLEPLNKVANLFGLDLFIGEKCDYIKPVEQGKIRVNFLLSNEEDMDLETKYIIKK